MTQFSQKQNDFSNLYKLLPVNLTWLHQVYEKMLYLQKHPDMLVSKMFSFIILFLFWLWLMLLPLFLGRCCYPFFDVVLVVSLLVMCGRWKKPLGGVKPLLFGRCYCQYMSGWCYCQLWLVEKLLNVVADAVATVADGMATMLECLSWQILYPMWQME